MAVSILPCTEEKRQAVSVSLPSDKSIFHRVLILSAISTGSIQIQYQYPIAADISSTIHALRLLGVSIQVNNTDIIIDGVGLYGLKSPGVPIDCGNSGTTARLFIGLLSVQSFPSTIVGDESLSKRPMKRLTDQLSSFAADYVYENNDGLPLTILPKKIENTERYFQTSSAQIKSAILLAALYSKQKTIIDEIHLSRDHSERMLNVFGADIDVRDERIEIVGGRSLECNEHYTIPADPSAAVFIAAAALLSNRTVHFHSILNNVRRNVLFRLIHDCGALLSYSNSRVTANEDVCDIVIRRGSYAGLTQAILDKYDLFSMIDEIPILAVLASFSDEIISFRNIYELRYKESDRIRSIVSNLRTMGIEIEEHDDGFTIRGRSSFCPEGGTINTFHDHRIAMSMALLGIRSKEAITISDDSITSVSFPNYFESLSDVLGKKYVIQH